MVEEVDNQHQIWPQTQLHARSVAYSTTTFFINSFVQLEASQHFGRFSNGLGLMWGTNQFKYCKDGIASDTSYVLLLILLALSMTPEAVGVNSSVRASNPFVLTASCFKRAPGIFRFLPWILSSLGSRTHTRAAWTSRDLKILFHPRADPKPKASEAVGHMLHPVNAWVENSDKHPSHSVTNSITHF